MAISQFNLDNGQRAERKLLITVAEWTEGSSQVREVLGTRTEDSSIEYNADISTTTDILGNNYTDINRTQPQQDFDPYLVLGGSKLGAKLNDIRKRKLINIPIPKNRKVNEKQMYNKIINRYGETLVITKKNI